MTQTDRDRMLAEIGVIALPQPAAPARIEHPAPWKPKHPGDDPPF
jgi:hypothetical protein